LSILGLTSEENDEFASLPTIRIGTRGSIVNRAESKGFDRLMNDRVTFLHITDPHLSAAGVPFLRDDFKVKIPAIPDGTRESSLDLLFRRLAERLTGDKRTLDAVLFSGDAQHRNAPGGHELMIEMLLRHLGPLGVAPNRIVSVPGNHDVPQGTPPSSAERYDSFRRVWRDKGCITPWFDGIDDWHAITSPERHRLVASDGRWAIFPVNTSNWSHVTSVLPQPLQDMWDMIPDRVAQGDMDLAEKLRSQLQALVRYDMARVSEHQLEALRAIVASTPQPDHGRQLRIAVMHHHLRSPSLREEITPFADISNLEQVRAFLSGSDIGVVVHGHKHEYAAHFDHIYSTDNNDMHRVLVISGATFESGREMDAARLITLTGVPHTPELTIEPIPLPRAGAESAKLTPIARRLWATNVRAGETVVVAPGAPITVEGHDLDEVYTRACAIAKADARGDTLIVHLDLPDIDTETLPLPRTYPAPDDLAGDERQTWLRELVHWWQLDRSQLERRIPYLHGSRLRRYGGKIDQIKRIISILKAKSSTRAVAVLVDPFRDFTSDGAGEEFASFCLVEFRWRESDLGRIVDAIAFYRAQEFERWWPINIAELRLLQREICQELGYRPGRITTIAADARTISRSPTQVAMPIVDRWLDQAPERLHLLAGALLHPTLAVTPRQAGTAREWRRSLAELRAATDAFNADGIPVAVEGLLTLSAYLEATVPSDDEELKDLARTLGDLARVNETFEQSPRDRAAFDRWAPVARNLLDALERTTEARLPRGEDSDSAP
jgi:3',5'-cyclic AMP phosphodiesterase CpdA